MKHKHNAIIGQCVFSMAALLLLVMSSDARAQGVAGTSPRPMSSGSLNSRGLNSGQPAPYQQRLSPYLDLLRTDNSVLGPYHSFVRPRQQLQQRINAQGAQMGRLQQTLQRSSSMTTSQPSRLQTGRGGTFNDHLHYYPARSTR